VKPLVNVSEVRPMCLSSDVFILCEMRKSGCIKLGGGTIDEMVMKIIVFLFVCVCVRVCGQTQTHNIASPIPPASPD